MQCTCALVTRAFIRNLVRQIQTSAALQVLKNSGVGDAFNNIGKQLKDGHWVLAFPNVEAANYATLLVDQHAAKLRAYYCEVPTRPSLRP